MVSHNNHIIFPFNIPGPPLALLAEPIILPRCQTAVFFDYYLNFLHPLFILMLCFILYTRKVAPKLPGAEEPAMVRGPVDSRLSSRSGYTRSQPYRQTDISQVKLTNTLNQIIS